MAQGQAANRTQFFEFINIDSTRIRGEREVESIDTGKRLA